jgi:adenylate cyclase
VKDVFSVQDEVVRTIVAILAAHVNKAEIERTQLKPPTAWQAYDYYMRAADTYASYTSLFKVEELYETRRLKHALLIDPHYARAYSLLALSHATAYLIPLDGDFLRPGALDRAHQLARKAVQLDPNLPQAHVSLGFVLAHKMDQHEASVAEFEAISLNPNLSEWRFARTLVFAGEPARAIQVIERNMRLDPFYQPLAPAWLGLAYYMLERYAEALPPLRECASRAPNLWFGHLCLAATYAQLGRLQEARAESAEVLRVQPTYSIDNTQRKWSIFKFPKDADHFYDGLRKAGLPER